MRKRLKDGEIECSFCGEIVLAAEFARRGHRCAGIQQIDAVLKWAIVEVLQGFFPAAASQGPYESAEQRALREKREAAAKFVSQFSGAGISWQQIMRYQADFEVSYRHAAIRCHPDRPDLGGSTELFQQLQEHTKTLKEMYGIRC